MPTSSAAEALAAEASAARLESAFCSLREMKRASARVEFEAAIHGEMENGRGTCTVVWWDGQVREGEDARASQ